MDKKSRGQILLLHALATGAAGLALRWLMYRTGFDDRGLLSRTNPLHIGCWILALALAGHILRRLRTDADVNITLPGSTRAVAAAAAAVLLALYGGGLMNQAEGALRLVQTGLALCCAAASAAQALLLFRGKGSPAPLHIPACLFFAADMLCRYQGWSGNPQLADYCFALIGSVCLSLTAYHRIALPSGLGSRKICLLCSLMGLCLCLYSLAGSEGVLLYLAGACWVLAGLSGPEKEEA